MRDDFDADSMSYPQVNGADQSIATFHTTQDIKPFSPIPLSSDKLSSQIKPQRNIQQNYCKRKKYLKRAIDLLHPCIINNHKSTNPDRTTIHRKCKVKILKKIPLIYRGNFQLLYLSVYLFIYLT